MKDISLLWKTDEQLGMLPMTLRAMIMFFAALILLRMGGIRVFGQKSALDTVIFIMLGAVLARGVVGASTLHATMAAATIMMLLNRIIAMMCQKNQRFNRFIKGEIVILFEAGKINREEMSKMNLNESDLMESLRLETQKDTFDEVEKAILETNGRISFILKKETTTH